MQTVSISELKNTPPREDQFKLKSIAPCGNKYSGNNKSILVFVNMPDRPGPFGNGKGTLQDEFNWRRRHAAPLAPSKLLLIIAPLLDEYDGGKHGAIKVNGLELTGKAFYSHYAGCSCPCSPGYIVRTNSYGGQRLALYLDHVDVIKRREEQAQAAIKAEEQLICQAMGGTA
jgi:hypothetical protein